MTEAVNGRPVGAVRRRAAEAESNAAGATNGPQAAAFAKVARASSPVKDAPAARFARIGTARRGRARRSPAGQAFRRQARGRQELGEKRSYGKKEGGFRKDGDRPPRRELAARRPPAAPEFNREDRPKRDFATGRRSWRRSARRPAVRAAMRRVPHSARRRRPARREFKRDGDARRAGNSTAKIARSAISDREKIGRQSARRPAAAQRCARSPFREGWRPAAAAVTSSATVIVRRAAISTVMTVPCRSAAR